jgi:nucleotide sugar dehydrogenase
MMRVQPSFRIDSMSDLKKQLSITVLETPVSAPPSPLLDGSKQSFITVQAAPPLSPPPEVNEFPVQPINQPLDHQLPSTPSPAETVPIVAVIGVGYVGTHLVEAFAHHYNVVAFDLSAKRLLEVASHLDGLPIEFTTDASDISQASHFLISVPTLLNADKTIDTTYLRSAITTVERHAKPGSTIVIESSVAVGMTRSLVGPLMHSKRFLVGMSPERVDPGRIEPAFEDIPKVISGLDQASIDSISALYGRVFANLLPVSSPEVAEMTKLYENCQRMVCAAYANEMANACEALGIDGFEVSAAAASKPFGYLPFRPGPGIGGHCIPVNPYYLLSTCAMPLLEHATSMSWERPASVAKAFMKSLIRPQDTVERGRMSPNPLRILVVGVGFKRGQSVLSNSPGAAIIRTLLSEWDTYIEFADPLVDAEQIDFCPKMDTEANWNEDYLETFDGIIVSVDQEGLDLNVLDRLRGVKVQDLSGRRRQTFNSDSLPIPTISVANFSEKLALQPTT